MRAACISLICLAALVSRGDANLAVLQKRTSFRIEIPKVAGVPPGVSPHFIVVMVPRHPSPLIGQANEFSSISLPTGEDKRWFALFTEHLPYEFVDPDQTGSLTSFVRRTRSI